MRTFMYGSLLVIVAGTLSGCGSSAATKPAPSAPSQSNNSQDTKAFLMQSGGVNVLKLTAPTDVKCVATDGCLKFDAPKFLVEVWLVDKAHTVDEGMGLVGSQIVSEFKNFKSNETTDLTIAGSPAKRMLGTGQEADDDDPGEADLVVFKVGDRIFVACNHGEKLNAAGHEGLLTLVQTAQVP